MSRRFVFGLTVVALAIAAQQASATELAFSPPTFVHAGCGPQSIALSDFDHDGHLDAVVANNCSNDVALLRANGDGTFTPWLGLDSGDHPTSVAVGDLNGDSFPDIVVANFTSNGIAWWLGNGDGSFGPKSTFIFGTASFGAYAVCIADVNGDGKADVLATSTAELAVSVFLGNGDGTFATRRVFLTGGSPIAVVAADFDHDGFMDIAVTSSENRAIAILRGDGTGNFDPKTDYATGWWPHELALGDFNEDGVQDLVTANAGDDFPLGRIFSNTVSVLLGNDDGTLADQLLFQTGGSYPPAVTVGDLDGDGHDDLVVCNFQRGHSVSVLRGHGDASFESAADFPAGTAIDCRIGDLNGDGRPDLVVADWDHGQIGVLLNLDLATATQFDLVSTDVEPGLVRLKWNVTGGTDAILEVMRGSAGAAWENLGPPQGIEAGGVEFEDPTHLPPGRYGYRLVAQRNGQSVIASETWVEVRARFALSLLGSRPNPARGFVNVEFALSSGAAARLDLIDIAGRVVATQEVGILGGGSHSIALPGAHRLPAGIYSLRLAQGRRAVFAKVCVVQ